MCWWTTHVGCCISVCLFYGSLYIVLITNIRTGKKPLVHLLGLLASDCPGSSTAAPKVYRCAYRNTTAGAVLLTGPQLKQCLLHWLETPPWTAPWLLQGVARMETSERIKSAQLGRRRCADSDSRRCCTATGSSIAGRRRRCTTYYSRFITGG
jgi:hypothetical protein